MCWVSLNELDLIGLIRNETDRTCVYCVAACAFHYQKRVALFAIDYGIYTLPENSAARLLLDIALGLCYLPEDYISKGIDYIETQVNSSCKTFGAALIDYLRRTWLPRKIR